MTLPAGSRAGFEYLLSSGGEVKYLLTSAVGKEPPTFKPVKDGNFSYGLGARETNAKKPVVVDLILPPDIPAGDLVLCPVDPDPCIGFQPAP